MKENKYKHYLRLSRAMDKIIGKENASRLLPIIKPVEDEENAEVNFQWAALVSTTLEKHLTVEEGIKVREQCSCIMTRSNTGLIKKLQDFRNTVHDDNEYLVKVAEYLDGRGRCGKKVEYSDGKMYSHWQFGSQCVCHLSKGQWKKSPSLLWCECCKGSALSVFKRLFDDKECHSRIVETFALESATDCVFEFWWE